MSTPVIVIDHIEERIAALRSSFARKGIATECMRSWDRAIEHIEQATSTPPLVVIGLELLLAEEGDGAAAASMQLMMMGMPSLIVYHTENAYSVQRLQGFAHFSSYLLWPATDAQLAEACGELLPRLPELEPEPATTRAAPPPVPQRRRKRPTTGWHALERLLEAESEATAALIIDDDQERAASLQDHLTHLGQSSHTMADAEEALAWLSGRPVSLVILGLEAAPENAEAIDATLHELGVPSMLIYGSMLEFEVAMLEDSCHFQAYLCWPAPDAEARSVLGELLGVEAGEAEEAIAAGPSNELDFGDLVDGHRETRLVVQIPSLSGGNLANIPLPRLLYFMAVQRRSGHLRISRGAQTLSVPLRDGWLVRRDDNQRVLSALQAAFSWERGSYAFEWDTIPDGKPVPLLDFIAEGIQQFVSFNTLLLQLSKYEKSYPAYTSLFLGRYKAFSRLPGVVDAARMCRGDRTLTSILRDVTGRYETFAPALAFCIHVDAVGMLEEAGQAPVGITYGLHDRLGRVEGAVDQKPALLGKTMMGFKPQATMAQIKSMSVSQYTLLNAYEKVQTYLVEHDPYASFALFPGCGRDAVRATFKRFSALLPDLPPRFPAPLKVTSRLVAAALQDAYLLLMAQEETDAPSHSADRVSELGPADLDRHLAALAPLFEKIRQEIAPPKPPPPRPAPKPEPAPTPEPEPARRPSLRSVDAVKIPEKRPSVVRMSAIAPELPPEDLLDDLLEGEVVEESPPAALEPPPELEPEEHFEEGLRHLQTNAFDEARDAFKRALKGDADNGLYLAYQAWSTYLRNPEGSASATTRKLRKARRMTGGLEMASYFLGSIALQAGNFEEARRFLKRALRENPDNYEAEQKLRLVKLREEQAAKGAGGLFGKLFKER